MTGDAELLHRHPHLSVTLGGYSYGSLIASRIHAPNTLSGVLYVIGSTRQFMDKDRIERLQTAAVKLVWANDDSSQPQIAQLEQLRKHQMIRASHLLISPLLPPVAGLLTLFSGSGLFSTNMDEYKHLVLNPTLAAWGEVDAFTSSSRLQTWAESLKTDGMLSQFQYCSIPEVDHFWQTPSTEVSRSGPVDPLQRNANEFRNILRGLEANVCYTRLHFSVSALS